MTDEAHEYYLSIEQQLVADGNVGKWVCVVEDQMLGVFDTREAAQSAGRTGAGNRDFLVREVRDSQNQL